MQSLFGSTCRRVIDGGFCFRGTVTLRDVLVDRGVGVPLKATVGGFCTARTGQDHLFFVVINASLASDELDPVLSVLVRGGLQVVVPRRREEGKDMLGLCFGILLSSNGSQVGEGDLVTKFCFGLVAIDGEEIGPEDNVYGFP